MSILASVVLGFLFILRPVEPWDGLYVNEARAIAHAAEMNPLPGEGKLATAAILTVMAYQESRLDPTAMHDNGAGYGLFGTHMATSGATKEELQDLDRSASIALRLIHTSFHICRRHPVKERLGWYAAGGIGCDRRLDLSRYRMTMAMGLMGEPLADEETVSSNE